ncbi:hypothetical protein ACRYWZ_08375 [Agrobacterium deltaense]|uniref:hypothetical protein n=1 Tax=Agrobacterium deltaense TaxID=1183412 RepID=UPI003D99B383
MPERSELYQIPSWPPTKIDRVFLNPILANIDDRLLAREALEASFEAMIAQGIQASLDYIQVNVAPQIANLQQSITLAQNQIDQIIIGGKAPDTLKFGGQLPAYYATAQALQDGLAGKVPTSRKINGKELSADFDLAKNDVGLGSVNNTADADKPISTLQQQALDAKVSGPKLLPAPGFLGRASDGEGAAEALTQPQARKLLGGWEPIGSAVSLAGIASIDWTNLDAFHMLYLTGSGQLNTGAVTTALFARLSEDNVNFPNNLGDYNMSRMGQEGADITGVGETQQTYAPICSPAHALAAGGTFEFRMFWGNFNKAGRYKVFDAQSIYTREAGARRIDFTYGYRVATANAQKALRFGAGGGLAFANGLVQLSGIRG